ncbi:hypothetical protein WG899_03875 [Paucibacter sp. AS339]|uniref:hypothetical protein n=1 Tax=Paucibacter hankyongi TaxID=3133434 RepID=UPI0030A1C031
MQVHASPAAQRQISSIPSRLASMPVEAAADLETQGHFGCGWYDSSYDLNSGLQVTEELDPSLLQLWARVLDASQTGLLTRH